MEIKGQRALKLQQVPSYSDAKDFWRNGHGRPIRVPTSSINFSSFHVASAPNVQRAVATLSKNNPTADVKWGSRKDTVSFTTDSPEFYVLGNISLKVEGTVAQLNDHINFSGTIKAFDDTYDFDNDWSRPLRTILTIGAKWDHGEGTPYQIQLEGAVHVDRQIK